MLKKADALRICEKLNSLYANDPNKFVKDCINFDGLSHKGLTWQQELINNKLIEHRFLCVSSGGGTGKSADAALLCLWFLSCHLFSRCPTTAPSRKQLKDVLWAQIAFWLKRFKYRDIFELTSDRLKIRGFDEWYAVARTVPKEGNANAISDTLAGFHGNPGKDDLLILVDEASGVPDPVFTAMEGAMTSGAYILLISNPVSTGGYYYDTINDPKGKGRFYKVLYLDSRESPLVDKQFEEQIIARYGKDHPMYVSKVLGQPITLLQSVVVTPERFDLVTGANRSIFHGDILLSVDVGGEADPSVLCHKIGDSIVRWDEYHLHKETDLAIEIERIFYKNYHGKNFKVIIDSIGKGSGVASILEDRRLFPVIRFVGSENSENKAMYASKRAEGYYNLSKIFESLHFPAEPPERLKKELANLFFDFSLGPINMEPKKKFIGRLGFSPDHADALMMACSEHIACSLIQAPYVSANVRTGLAILVKDTRFKEDFRKFVV